jgi:hypothetical protein
MLSAESRDLQILLPPGVLHIHSDTESTSTTLMKKKDKAYSVLPQNTLEYLRQHFIEIDNLYSKRLNGGIALTMEPSKPYSYGGVMVVAAHEEIASGASAIEKQIRTYNIYDYEPELQIEYFRQIIASLKAQALTELPRSDIQADPRAIAIENTQVKISDFENKMARSIALPHANVIKIGGWIDSTTPAPNSYGLHVEQEFMQSEEQFLKFIDFCCAHLSRDTEHSIVEVFKEIQLRGEPPFGYTLTTSINFDDSLGDQSKELTFLLNENHHIYEEFSLTRIDEENQRRKNKYRPLGAKTAHLKSVESQIIPQPSYRTYIYFIDGKLRVTISPSILSTAGVVEAVGIYFHRSPNNPRAYTDEELKLFQNQFSSNLIEQLA